MINNLTCSYYTRHCYRHLIISKSIRYTKWWIIISIQKALLILKRKKIISSIILNILPKDQMIGLFYFIIYKDKLSWRMTICFSYWSFWPKSYHEIKSVPCILGQVTFFQTSDTPLTNHFQTDHWYSASDNFEQNRKVDPEGRTLLYFMKTHNTVPDFNPDMCVHFAKNKFQPIFFCLKKLATRPIV